MTVPATERAASVLLPLTPQAATSLPAATDELSDDDLEHVVGGLARARMTWDAGRAASSAHSGM